MISRYFIASLFLFTTLSSWSKTSVLDRIISINIKSTPVKVILHAIEQRANVIFSYNPDLIDDEKVVSLSIEKKTIKFGLALIFNKTVRFKEVGNHIVLLRNEDDKVLKERRKSNLFTVFKGVVTEKESSVPIAGASVYDIDARYAVTTDAYGMYELKVPKAETIRSLYVRKKGYREHVYVVDASSDSVIVHNVALVVMPKEIAKMPAREAEQLETPIEDKLLSGGMVSEETYTHNINLADILEDRVAQISLVPSISFGSNLSTNGLIVNNFSLNILAGYSNGTDGAELGGILNINKGDARWFQAGGIANVVGGDFTGAQFGGIVNTVRGNFLGAQFGGIGNRVGGSFTGFQASGIAGLVHKDLIGAQFGGISAAVTGRFTGIQAGGIFSAARCGFKGLQIGGIGNLCDSTVVGAQLAGIHNSAHGAFYGLQVAGISNYSRDGLSFVQFAGISNHTRKNVGLQVGGIINYARQNNGLQVGLINLSKESKGMAIGLVNFVLNGYHKTELAANESFPINLTFKTGNRHFYNLYHFSVLPGSTPVFAAGLGYGTNFNLSEKWLMSMDLSAQMAFENNFESFEFAQLYRFSTTVDYQLAKWIAVFAGPTVNFNNIQFANAEGAYTSSIGVNPMYEEAYANGLVRGWIGGQVGVRL